METVLENIVKEKKKWLIERKKTQPIESFICKVTPTDRDFVKALSGFPAKFILECKKASPSKGLIRADFNLDFIASVYAKHAAVVSVLTDEKFFQGRFDFLPLVRAQVSCPILCKDFMIDPYQVYLARYYQADAILLMLSVLDNEQYRELAYIANELKLGILTEISNQEELERAIALNAAVVGINNRNLRDLSVNLETTKTLAPLLPKNTIVISESGIYSHQQVRELAPYVNGFLIGSALMAETELEHAVRRIIYGDNKVCGLTRKQDAKAAYDANANYGGLIFVEKSPRYIDIARATKIITGAPLKYVGVFQNHSLPFVTDTANALNLAAVQLHGDEDHKYVNTLRGMLPTCVQIWKAHGVEDAPPTLEPQADRNLLDSRQGAQYGGTGNTFDWSLIPAAQKETVMIAGGISDKNAIQAASFGCAGLDFNSGVETRPGIKNEKKLKAAFAALRKY